MMVAEIQGTGGVDNSVSLKKVGSREEWTVGKRGAGESREAVSERAKVTESYKRLSVLNNASGGVVRVLRELDQNLNRGENKMGKGAWKRRARQIGKTRGMKLEEGVEMDCNKTNVNGKRGFRLQDEDSLEKKNGQTGKKVKVGMEVTNYCTQMVEVASQKWHQPDP